MRPGRPLDQRREDVLVHVLSGPRRIRRPTRGATSSSSPTRYLNAYSSAAPPGHMRSNCLSPSPLSPRHRLLMAGDGPLHQITLGVGDKFRPELLSTGPHA